MPIKVTCDNCDREYNLADDTAGKRLKCKACGDAFTVPGGSASGVRTGRPGARRRAAAREEDDRPSRREKPRRSGGLVWWLVGGGVAVVLLLVLVGGGVLLFVLFAPTKATPENFARIRSGMTEKDVRDIMGPPADGLSMNNPFTKMAGLNVPNVKELVWHGRGNTEFVVLFQDGKVIEAIGSDGRNVIAPAFGEDGGFPGFPGGDVPKPPDFNAWPNANPNPNVGGASPTGQTLEANFRRLRRNMSEPEVLAIFGLPTHTTDLPDQQFAGQRIPGRKVLTWRVQGGNDRVEVTIQGGRVTEANGFVAGKGLFLNQ